MDTDSPASVVAQIGAIEDGLAINQNAHAEVKGITFRTEQQLKMLRAALMRDAEGTNEAQRKAEVELAIQESKVFEDWLNAKEQLDKHTIRYEYLSKRLSACQSILKRFEHDAYAGRFGQAASNRDG